MREGLEFCKIYGGAHSTGACEEEKEPLLETKPELKSIETGILPETALEKDTIIRQELNFLERAKGRAKEVAAILALVTALSVLGPARAEAWPWPKSKAETSRIEMVQEGEVRYLYGYDEKGNPPEWVNKKFFEDEKGVFVVGSAKGVDSQLTRRLAKAAAKQEIIAAAMGKLKQEIKEQLLKKGESKEYVESEEFEVGINSWLNKASKEEIPFIGIMPNEKSCLRQIEEIEDGEVKYFYEAHVCLETPKESFDFIYTWLKNNFKEVMKTEK